MDARLRKTQRESEREKQEKKNNINFSLTIIPLCLCLITLNIMSLGWKRFPSVPAEQVRCATDVSLLCQVNRCGNIRLCLFSSATIDLKSHEQSWCRSHCIICLCRSFVRSLLPRRMYIHPCISRHRTTHAIMLCARLNNRANDHRITRVEQRWMRMEKEEEEALVIVKLSRPIKYSHNGRHIYSVERERERQRMIVPGDRCRWAYLLKTM